MHHSKYEVYNTTASVLYALTFWEFQSRESDESFCECPALDFTGL